MVERALRYVARLKATLDEAWLRVARAVPPLGRAGAFTGEVVRKYQKDDCFSYAASLSFWLIVSLVPLSTLLFKLLGTVLGSKAYGWATMNTLHSIIPYLPRGFLADAVANSQKIGNMGFSWIVLLFGSYWGVRQLDTSLAHVFGLRIKKHRQTRKNHLLRRVGILVGGILMMVLFLALLVGGALRRHLPLPRTDFLPVLPPLLVLIVSTMVLQHLPRLHVKFRHAILGAGISTSLWWVAKWGFGIYLKHTMTWGIMYGSLIGIVAALTFLYYSCAIFLLGAEITAAFYRHETGAVTVPSWARVKAGNSEKR